MNFESVEAVVKVLNALPALVLAVKHIRDEVLSDDATVTKIQIFITEMENALREIEAALPPINRE